MPLPNYHSARIYSPSRYRGFAYKRDMFGPGIDAVLGILDRRNAEIQSIRFDRCRYTIKQVRAWLKKHPEYIPLKVEPAARIVKKNPAGLRLPKKSFLEDMYGAPGTPGKDLKMQYQKLRTRILKTFPNSPRQKQLEKQAAELRKKILKIDPDYRY